MDSLAFLAFRGTAASGSLAEALCTTNELGGA